jgi:hypothetical protein
MIWLNVIELIIVPIVAVWIGQKLQERAKKREDKMEIFKTLMTSRIYGWTEPGVRALNIIDVVFADDENVRKQWKKYYDKLCTSNPTDMDIRKIQQERDKLLEVMAVSLGYKDKITWETIQNPYIPKGMLDQMTQQQVNQNNQIEIMEKMKSVLSENREVNLNEQNEI